MVDLNFYLVLLGKTSKFGASHRTERPGLAKPGQNGQIWSIWSFWSDLVKTSFGRSIMVRFGQIWSFWPGLVEFDQFWSIWSILIKVVRPDQTWENRQFDRRFGQV